MTSCSECGGHVPLRHGPGRPRLTCGDRCARDRTARQQRERFPSRLLDLRDCERCRAPFRTERTQGGRSRICEDCRALRNYGRNAFWYSLRNYGIDQRAWHAMLIVQAGRCDICNVPMQQPCVDHCHRTSSVRGLLCTRCNTGLGMFLDSTTYLRAAAAYLEKES